MLKDAKVNNHIRERLADALNKAQMTKNSDSRDWLLRRNTNGALAYFRHSSQ